MGYSGLPEASSRRARFLLCSLDLTHHVTGCPFMTASAIQFFLPHTCQFMETLLSTSLSSFISTPPLRPASRSLIDVSRPRDSKATRYGQRTLRNVAPSLWNALPRGIKESDSFHFNASLKTFLQLLLKTFSVMMFMVSVLLTLMVILMECVCVCVCVCVCASVGRRARVCVCSCKTVIRYERFSQIFYVICI